jgi:predicted Ser/Thr protein kinase
MADTPVTRIGNRVAERYAGDRRLIAFEQLLDLFAADPYLLTRSSVQYLRDAVLHFGSYETQGVGGKVQRWKIFDAAYDGGEGAIIGQERPQRDLVDTIFAAAREGRLDRMIVLHGPNGSGKSSLVELLQRGLEEYSHEAAGAVYALRWIFPKGAAEGASLGFGGQRRAGDRDSYALLDPPDIAARVVCEFRDNPLYVIPDSERAALLEDALAKSPARKQESYRQFLGGNLCPKCKAIYENLLAAYKGNWREVVKHVQVERVFVSRRFRVGAVVTQPQGTVDAALAPLTANAGLGGLPPFLASTPLHEVQGDLPDANRGLMEFSDFLKRNLELSKYLLQTTERGFVTVGNQLLEMDIVFTATINERHLEAFRQIPEFASFQGRMHFVRVPYSREFGKEAQVYRKVCAELRRMRHVAPHVAETVALFAVLTRLERPHADRYDGELSRIAPDLAPLEKLALYDESRPPERLDQETARILVRAIPDIALEHDRDARYEGRVGASVRDLRSALLRAAVRREGACVTPSAIEEEFASLIQEKGTYRFLQFDPEGEYHDADALLDATVAQLGRWIVHDVEDAMEIVSGAESDRRFDLYFHHLVAHTRRESVRDPATGRTTEPDVKLLESVESAFPINGPVDGWRRSLVARIGAYAVDHPDERPIDFRKLFADLLRPLRRRFFDQRRDTVTRVQRQLLLHGTPEFGDLPENDRRLAERTLENLTGRLGYCAVCAKDAVDFALAQLKEDA